MSEDPGRAAGTPGTIEQRLYLKATPQRVWRALSDAEDFGAWFGGPIDGPLMPGRTVTLRWGARSFGFDVVEMIAERRLAWRWHPGEINAAADVSGEAKTLVSFEIAPFHEGVLLTMRESGFDLPPLAHRPQAYADNVLGWLHQANALLRHLATTGPLG